MKFGARGRLLLLMLGMLVIAGVVGATLQAAVASGLLQPGEAVLPALVVCLVTATWLSGAWTRPVRELAAAAGALARGLPRRAPVLATDEHGHLAESFNHLARALESSRDDLLAVRDRFDTVVGGMREGVLALSVDGRILLCNPAAMMMLDWPDPPIDQRLREIMRQPLLHDLLDSRAPDRPREIELSLEDGRTLAVRAQLMHRAGLGALLVLRDLTALRRVELMRRDFVANASHELRTPVANILSAAEALEGGALQDPEAAGEFTGIVHRNASRMTQIVADMLDLSRLDAGAVQIEAAPVPLAERLQHACAAIEATARTRHQTVRILVDGLPVARADVGALDQVLANLLDNASKYTPEGGRIVLSAMQAGGRVVLRVADDGPGISSHHRERVFERFYRVDAGRSRDLGGTGLGLSIVRNLCEAMGGRVTCEPNRPQGTVFRVELPAA